MKSQGMALATLLLTGCALALSPAELRETGKRETFTTPRMPRDAAQCITRAAENYRPGIADPFPANWREGERTGEFEVLVRHPMAGFVIVSEIKPHQSGSLITTWLSPNIVYQDLSERVVERCDAKRLDALPIPGPTPMRDAPLTR